MSEEGRWNRRGHLLPRGEFNSLTKDGLINKSITHARGAGGMNAYRVDKDRGEDVDKIGGCPRVLVVEQRGARHGINVWPPRQNIHARPDPLPPFPPILSALLPPLSVSANATVSFRLVAPRRVLPRSFENFTTHLPRVSPLNPRCCFAFAGGCSRPAECRSTD